jgi:hypothetical protein
MQMMQGHLFGRPMPKKAVSQRSRAEAGTAGGIPGTAATRLDNKGSAPHLWGTAVFLPVRRNSPMAETQFSPKQSSERSGATLRPLVPARGRPKVSLNEELERLAARLPDRVARFVRWVRQPSSGFVRYPLAILLILGGLVGFLPILGFWMVPLGLILIAQDFPFLCGPLARMLKWINERLPERM